jgi:hypothetical protein
VYEKSGTNENVISYYLFNVLNPQIKARRIDYNWRGSRLFRHLYNDLRVSRRTDNSFDILTRLWVGSAEELGLIEVPVRFQDTSSLSNG